MSGPRIEDYRFGKIVVDGEEYGKDLILLPDRVVSGWWREDGHRLAVADLDAVFEAGPDVLVVGRGAYGRMRVPDEVEDALQSAGIALVARPTKQACETYNELRETRAAAAALHLTC
jgi:hypothetical protein